MSQSTEWRKTSENSKMNADSSDWKRFIPYSEELSALYDELDTCSENLYTGETTPILPPNASGHYDLFADANTKCSQSNLEQQLMYIIMIIDNEQESHSEV